MSKECAPDRDDPAADDQVRQHAAYLGEILTFDDAIHLLAKSQIALDALVSKVDILEKELIVLRSANVESINASEIAGEATRRTRLISERFLKVLNAQAAKREKMSSKMAVAGEKSGRARAENAKAPIAPVMEYHEKMILQLGERYAVGATAKHFGVSDTRIRQILKMNQNQT